MTNLTISLFAGFVVLYAFVQLFHSLSHKNRVKINGCAEPPRYPHRDPFFGIDLFLQHMNAFKSGCFLDFNKLMFDKYGKTFKANVFGTTTYRTIDPEISKAVHATYASKFGLQPLRYEVAKHLWGNGIIVVDGDHWKRGRALMRPSFEVVHLANFDSLRKHVSVFVDLLPEDGSTVNLMPLFQRLILDTSSEFIFGECMGALQNPTFSERFSDAFSLAQKGTGIRAMLKHLKFLHRDPKWWEACNFVTDYADEHVKKALLRLEMESVASNKNATGTRDKQVRLVDEMAKDTQDKITLRSHIISVFSPAHDGAATALTNAIFHLARHPTVWEKLREEVYPSRNELLTYELLNSFEYLEFVLKETHRLTPIATVNQRQCLETTILPFGGGSGGKQPLYVEKGDIIELNYRAMMRDETFWGKDADDFIPERWEHIRPGWEYTPFGGGPRTCPGQRLVFTESAFVLVTLIRKFRKLENRDSVLEWQEEMRMTFQSKNGCLVGLIPL